MYYYFNNISLYYEKYGNNNKKTIIILPGWGNTRSTFYNMINHLKDNFCIYIFDYPGFGFSKSIDTSLTIYDYADLFYNFIVNNNINEPFVISHSFGGRIISILIGKYKLKVNKLVLIDVAGIKRKNIKLIIKEKIYKFLKKMSFFLSNKNRIKFNNYLINYFGSTDYKNINHCMRETFKNIINEDLRNYYQLINCPTLIIWGDKDKDTPIKDAYLINKYINDSAVIIYKDSGHFCYLDYHNNIINVIKHFFK